MALVSQAGGFEGELVSEVFGIKHESSAK
jgi:hypothetical protein